MDFCFFTPGPRFEGYFAGDSGFFASSVVGVGRNAWIACDVSNGQAGLAAWLSGSVRKRRRSLGAILWRCACRADRLRLLGSVCRPSVRGKIPTNGQQDSTSLFVATAHRWLASRLEATQGAVARSCSVLVRGVCPSLASGQERARNGYGDPGGRLVGIVPAFALVHGLQGGGDVGRDESGRVTGPRRAVCAGRMPEAARGSVFQLGSRRDRGDTQDLLGGEASNVAVAFPARDCVSPLSRDLRAVRRPGWFRYWHTVSSHQEVYCVVHASERRGCDFPSGPFCGPCHGQVYGPEDRGSARRSVLSAETQLTVCVGGCASGHVGESGWRSGTHNHTPVGSIPTLTNSIFTEAL